MTKEFPRNIPPTQDAKPDLTLLKNTIIDKLSRFDINQFKNLGRALGIFGRNEIILQSREKLAETLTNLIEKQTTPTELRIIDNCIVNLDDL